MLYGIFLTKCCFVFGCFDNTTTCFLINLFLFGHGSSVICGAYTKKKKKYIDQNNL